MLDRPLLFALGGHVLHPVIDLITSFIIPGEVFTRPVVVIKLHMLIENFGLHIFSDQYGREAVFICLNQPKTNFTHSRRCVLEHREKILRHIQECNLILFPKVLAGNLILIVEPVGILFYTTRRAVY